MNDADALRALVKAAQDDLALAPLVLADWLADRDREREAVLLRRRHKAWKNDRADIETWDKRNDDPDYCEWTVKDTLDKAAALVATDKLFRNYIGERFGRQMHDLKRWFRHYGIDHAVPVQRPMRGYIRACCGLLAVEGEVSAIFGKRICRACRRALATLAPAEQAVTT